MLQVYSTGSVIIRTERRRGITRRQCYRNLNERKITAEIKVEGSGYVKSNRMQVSHSAHRYPIRLPGHSGPIPEIVVNLPVELAYVVPDVVVTRHQLAVEAEGRLRVRLVYLESEPWQALVPGAPRQRHDPLRPDHGDCLSGFGEHCELVALL